MKLVIPRPPAPAPHFIAVLSATSNYVYIYIITQVIAVLIDNFIKAVSGETQARITHAFCEIVFVSVY